MPKRVTNRQRTPALLIRAAKVFLLLQVLALGAVAAGDLVPDREIVEELNSAIDSGAITATATPKQRTGGVSAHYGECVQLSIGLGAWEGDGWFTQIATSPSLHACPPMIDRLKAHQDGARLSGIRHLRYWNGLSVIARPALATIGVNGLRTLSMLLLVGSLVVLAKTVNAAVGGRSAVALLGPVLLGADLFGLVEVFHNPLILSFGFLGIAALARRAAQDQDWDDLLVAGFVVGSVYSFFTVGNFVPGIWAMSAAVVAACVPVHRELATRARRMIAIGVSWLAGFASMWTGKWVWAAVTTSPSAVFDEITAQIEFRINGVSRFATGRFGEGLRANVQFWLDQPLVPTVVVVSGFVIVTAIVRSARNDLRSLWTAVLIASPVSILFAWQLAFNNANEIHYWREYRSLPMVLGVVLMALHAPAAVEDHKVGSLPKDHEPA